MTLRFVLMVNKQGQTRLAQYYEKHQMDERCALEAEVESDSFYSFESASASNCAKH